MRACAHAGVSTPRMAACEIAQASGMKASKACGHPELQQGALACPWPPIFTALLVLSLASLPNPSPSALQQAQHGSTTPSPRQARRPPRLRLDLRGEHRRGRVRTHAARVGPRVAVAHGFVILRAASQLVISLELVSQVASQPASSFELLSQPASVPCTACNSATGQPPRRASAPAASPNEAQPSPAQPGQAEPSVDLH